MIKRTIIPGPPGTGNTFKEDWVFYV